MVGFYVVYVRGYETPDPVRAARFGYRKKVGGRLGLLPPSREPVGILLWVVTALGFLAAIAFFLVGDRFVGASSGTMVLAFGFTLWRDERWIREQTDYQDIIEALEEARNEATVDSDGADSDGADSDGADSDGESDGS